MTWKKIKEKIVRFRNNLIGDCFVPNRELDNWSNFILLMIIGIIVISGSLFIVLFCSSVIFMCVMKALGVM